MVIVGIIVEAIFPMICTYVYKNLVSVGKCEYNYTVTKTESLITTKTSPGTSLHRTDVNKLKELRYHTKVKQYLVFPIVIK